MVGSVTLSGETRPKQTYSNLVAVDESGQHSSDVPTVVAAVYVSRSNAEKLAVDLCESGIFPWNKKSKDVSSETIYKFFDSSQVKPCGMMSYSHPSSSQRALMAFESVKQAIKRTRNQGDQEADCLVLLDGQASNYGGEKPVLRCYNEILDDYFQNKYNLSTEVAVLETADKRYPEVTTADCACRKYINDIRKYGDIREIRGLSRFNSDRGVPQVEFKGQIRQVSGEGTSNTDTVAARAVAWAKGGRPAEDMIGDLDQNLRRVVNNRIESNELAERILSESNRPGSQQE